MLVGVILTKNVCLVPRVHFHERIAGGFVSQAPPRETVPLAPCHDSSWDMVVKPKHPSFIHYIAGPSSFQSVWPPDGIREEALVGTPKF
jgi:hypothetical protein